jgi:hypothetical protein
MIKLFFPRLFEAIMRSGKGKKKKRGKKEPEVLEKEIKIKAGEYYFQALGELEAGAKITGTCFETVGENFSYYVLNAMGKSTYEAKGEIKKPVCVRRNKTKTTFNCVIKHKNSYYILFTHQASKNPRNIQYRIELL